MRSSPDFSPSNDDESVFSPGTGILQGKYTLREMVEAGRPECGAPAVWMVEGPGAWFVAKVWARGAGNDPALEAIWNHELRSLLRLTALQRAQDLFAGLEALGKDANGYYVVVDGGRRRLLSEALAERDLHVWLRRIADAPTRARLWSGMHTLATALATLHEQGVLHRALTAGCVFTDFSGECDFRLSGFEWSLRLNAGAGLREGSGGAGPGRVRAPELGEDTATYSVASDWFDFGLLAAELVGGFTGTGTGLPALYELSKRIARATHLGSAEKALLQGLLLPNPDERRLECADVGRKVAILLNRMSGSQTAARDLHVAVHLATGSTVGDAIFKLSDGRVRPGDIEAQLAFIRDDLAGATGVRVRSGRNPHYSLEGRELVYRLVKFVPRRAAAGWRVAFCPGLERGSSEAGETMPLDGRKIVVSTAMVAERLLAEPSWRCSNWDDAFPFGKGWDQGGGEGYDFLRITNTIDAFFAAARIWPVEVVSVDVDGDTKVPVMTLVAARDDQRDAVARAFGMETPARQMERRFVDEADEAEGPGEFSIGDEAQLSQLSRKAGCWIFRNATVERGGRRYVFVHSRGDTVAATGLAYLRPADLGGSYALLERRLKAIEALRDQSTMLRAFETPGLACRDTLEAFVEDDEVRELDDRKRQALQEIWRAQPIFALQGPPGTGKTKLVESLIRRALEDDASLQFVATAQANSTVDFLGLKLSKRSAGPDGPIVVRLDQDEGRNLTPLAPARIAEGLAARLEASQLVRDAPAHIRRRLLLLAGGGGQEGKREGKDLARLVARAANVVLATTTSGELSDIVHDGKRFDWSIVEEAGKAHGFDLALPMLASHRLLLIGDHEQLPAFNEGAFSKLFGSPGTLHSALTQGARLLPRRLSFDLGSADPQEASAPFESRCSRWLPMVRSFEHVFEGASSLPPGGTAIAARLDEQHRMHPEICDLVRACFYPDLKTADIARGRLTGLDPFHLVEGSWLPSERIVFVDMPWIQSTPGAKGQDQRHDGTMRLSSAVEAQAVVDVLAQVVPDGQCDLQVLTPYNAQVPVIQRALSIARSRGQLPWLDGFRKPKGKESFGSTIDGFQGEEADVVVVSLVRNNHRTPPGGAGHLAERARLNVMLSRAARKLILVGSWDFFARRAGEQEWKDPTHGLHDLAVVFRELSQAFANGTARKVPLPGQPTR